MAAQDAGSIRNRIRNTIRNSIRRKSGIKTENGVLETPHKRAAVDGGETPVINAAAYVGNVSVMKAAADAGEASVILAAADSELKNRALAAIADALLASKESIFTANKEDLDRSTAEGISAPLLKRLKFDDVKLDEVVDGIRKLITIDDPVGKVQMETELDEGLVLYRKSCPIGVIGVIFESRPDALVQISALCLKSGNALLLKGGSEAKLTNAALFDVISRASAAAGIDRRWATLLGSREDVAEMLRQDKFIDLIIPRGSNDFVRFIKQNTAIPVMGHSDGICHCYADKSADICMAVNIIVDSKAQYAAVCNATETLLVHADAAPKLLPPLKDAFDALKVEMRGCERTRAIIDVKAATMADWSTEYLDYIISVKVVDSLEEAVNHINRYGSGHTDAIITESNDAAAYFEAYVDSANVFRNCSTRFSDGYRYGFGAEVGVSTAKVHARGPVGIEGLLIYKYVLEGSGQIVDDYVNKRKVFKHNRKI